MLLAPAPFHSDVAEGPEGGAAHWMECADGVRIRVGHWPCADARGTVLLLPGRTEFIEKYGRAAADLAARGYATVSVDWRGQGLSDRLTEDPRSGYVGVFTDYQLDVAETLRAAHLLKFPEPFFLLAHSMGGCIGLRALIDGLPVNAAVFSAPMWGIMMSAVLRPAAWAVSWTSKKVGRGEVYAPGTSPATYVLDAPFEGNHLTSDPDMYRYMAHQVLSYPELAIGGPSMHWLHEALGETRELAALPSPDVPCITFLGSFEQIVESSRIHERMENWPGGELELIEGAEHEVLMETPDIRAHVVERTVSLFNAHCQ